MGKKPQKKKHLLSNPIFYFFLILLAGITNMRHSAVLDKELEPRVLALSLFLFVLILFPLLTMKKPWSRIDIKTIKNPFTYFYLAYIAITGISIFVAANSAEALHEFLKVCTFFTLYIYLALYILPKENSRQLFLKAFVIFSLIASLVGVIQAFNIFPEHGFSVKAAYLIKGNFSHKNMFSQILFLSFTFALYSIFEFKNGWRKAAFAGALFNLVLIIALMTRSVWVALFVSTLVSFIVYYVYIRKNASGHIFTKPVIITLSSIVGAGILAVVLFSQLDKDNSIKKHVLEATDFTSGNTYHRLNIWKKSGPIIKEHPIIGVGAGNWKTEILKYDVVLYQGGWIVPRRTHNDYISVVTETGALGLIAYLGMFLTLIIFGIKTIKKQKDKNDKLFALALLFGLVGYMTFSFFSFTKERIETQILLNTIFAFIVYRFYTLKTDEKSITPKPVTIKAVAGILLVALSFTSFSAYKRMKAEIAMNKFYGMAQRKASPQQLYKYVKGIRSPFVSLTPMSSPFLLLESHIMMQLNHNLDKVIEKNLKALEDCPYHPKTLVQLAYLYSSKKDNKNALKYSKVAFKYAPSNKKVVTAYAAYLEKLGKEDEAYKVLSEHPAYLDPQFDKMLMRLLLKQLIEMQKSADHKLLEYKIAEISKEQERLVAMHKLAIRKNIDFKRIVLSNVLKKIRHQKAAKVDTIKSPIFKELGFKKYY